VVAASVDFLSDRASVQYLSSLTAIDAMIAAIQKAGATPSPQPKPRRAKMPSRRHPRRKSRSRHGKSSSAPPVAFLFASLAWDGISASLAVGDTVPGVNRLFLALAIPVQFCTGWGYYTGGWNSLRLRTRNMDGLVAVAFSSITVVPNGLRLYHAGIR
jgi:Cu+-exporting ATPase